MITIPSLVFLGLSPQMAIATDLVGLFGGRVGGLLGLIREGRVDVRLALRLSVFTTAGAFGGAFALLQVPEASMKRLLGVFLLCLLGFVLALPRLGVEDRPAVGLGRRVFGHVLFVLVGFWGTLVGAGFLNLGSAVLLLVLRRGFLETAGALTLVGLTVSVVALLVFGSHGSVVWPLALAMLLGKLTGGYLGARYAVRVGEAKIRLLFIAVVTVSAVRLLV